MGLMPYLPDYQLLANQRDITTLIRERFISLRYTDEAGIASDMLEIVLSDYLPNQPLRVPPTGASLDLSIGYAGTLRHVGLFVVDEVELAGVPSTLTIRARAAGFDQSATDMVGNMKTQKTRAWPAGTLFGDIVQKIAQEHTLKPACSVAFASRPMPHIAQVSESDINLLLRLAKDFGAIVKVTAGRLVVAEDGATKSVSGKALPLVKVNPSEVSGWRVTLAERDTTGTVIATWHSTQNAQTHEVSVGDGEPVIRLKDGFPSEELARAAARADWLRRRRGGTRLTVELIGRADLVAEGRLRMAGFRSGVDGDWSITRAEHRLDNSGYRSSVEAELPNEFEAVPENNEKDGVEDEQ